MLSIYDSPVHLQQAFAAGATGYVSKQEMGDTLLAAIRAVLDGERYVSPKIRVGLNTI